MSSMASLRREGCSLDNSGGYNSNLEAVCTMFGLSLALDDSHPFQDKPNVLIRGRDIRVSEEMNDHQMSSENINDSEDEYVEDEYEDDTFVIDDEYDSSSSYQFQDNDTCEQYMNVAFYPIEVSDHERLGCDKSKNLKVYLVLVNTEECVESQCVDMLKQIGCDQSCFLRCSKNFEKSFYAKLDKEQAARLKCVDGFCNMWLIDELFWDD